MIRCRFVHLCALFVLLIGLSRRESLAVGVWHRDYASGLAEAKAEGKSLMLVFTGTDWIEICGKFYDEILGDPAFIELVSAKFALVKLEYPKDSLLPRSELAEKALLRDAYRVRGFPTVLLTDAAGRPFGINGYQPISAKEYAEQILEIKAAHEGGMAMVEQAASLSGIERARALVKSLPDLPDALLARFFGKELREILDLDARDELTLRDRFQRILADEAYEREIQTLLREKKWDEMIALTDRQIADRKLAGEALQGALLNRAGFERRAGREQDCEATLRRIVSLDAESGVGKEAARLLEAGTAPAKDASTR